MIFDKTVLRKRLDDFASTHQLPGLRHGRDRARLVRMLLRSQKTLRALRLKNFAGSTDPSRTDFHPYKAVIERFASGDIDEAIWVAFLIIHFGWSGRKSRASESIRLFYSKFGTGLWNWEEVLRNPQSVRDWMLGLTKAQLRQLKFGNHRKYETNNPRKTIGTPAVIRSFMEWTKRGGGGSPARALHSFSTDGYNPQDAFDRAYRSMSIKRFGRTARFDFLCLLANLGVVAVDPPHCYLEDATGPRAGALLIVKGNKNAKWARGVSGTIESLGRHLTVAVEAWEDALCNWQKGEGFVSRMCY